MIIRAHCCVKVVEVDFDQSDGIEVLLAQLASIFEIDVILLDAMGVEIMSVEDIEDIIKLEISKTDSVSTAGLVPQSLSASAAAAAPVDGLAGEGEGVTVADVWCLAQHFGQLGAHCSAELFGDDEVMQPRYRIVDTDIQICAHCSMCLDSGLVVCDSRHGGLSAFSCQGKRATELGLLCHVEDNHALKGVAALAHMSAPVSIFLKRLFLQSCINDQQAGPAGSEQAQAERDIEARLLQGKQLVRGYEDDAQQRLAREAVDYAKVREYALRHLQEKEGACEDAAFLVGLLNWFKTDFFKWVNKPHCEIPGCGAGPDKMRDVRIVVPSEEEREVGHAGRTELYECSLCKAITRFPRFNKPSHLLRTRRGRCGEFSNCFTLICRSLSLDARWVLDFTDHVWTEVWVPSLGRYVHLDSCERALDSPLMYEKGWAKKLSYVFSFSRHGVVDATPRYTRKLAEVLTRRGGGGAISEKFVAESVRRCDADLELTYTTTSKAASSSSRSSLHLDLLQHGPAGFEELALGDCSITTVRRRKRLLAKELAGLVLAEGTGALKEEEKQGRVSGDRAWKKARGELGEAGGRGPPLLLEPTLCMLCPGLQLAAATQTHIDIVVGEGSICAGGVPMIGRPGTGHTVLCIDSRGAAKFLRCVDSNAHISPPPPPCASDQFPKEPLASVEDDDLVAVSVLDGGDAWPEHEGQMPAWLRGMHDGAGPNAEDGFVSAEVASSLKLRCSLPHPAEHSPDDVVLCRVEQAICSVPASILLPMDGETLEAFSSRAVEQCRQSIGSLGVSVTTDVAVLFGQSGYPLRPSANSTTFVKTRARANGMPNKKSRDRSRVLAALRYYHLGGGQHSDTQPFDSTECLWSLCDALSLDNDALFADLWASLVLTELDCWASEYFNGLQATFSMPGVAGHPPFSSPRFLSDHGSPQKFKLYLDEGETITTVGVASGAIVDSFRLVTSAGKEVRFGGAGGTERVFTVPEGWKLVGFYGGRGGHVHNLGVVVARSFVASPYQEMPLTLSSTVIRLLEAASRHDLWTCGLLSRCLGGDTERAQAHPSVGTLLSLMLEVLGRNPPAVAKTCLQSIAAYLQNILSNMSDSRVRRVKTTNRFFNENVLRSAGGLELFSFGVGGFVLATDGSCLESAVRLFAEGGDVKRDDWQIWITRYLAFLREATSSLLG